MPASDKDVELKHRLAALQEEKMKVFESISFACGGWLQFYMFGVAKALQETGYASHFKKLCGCSAGALTAVGLCLEGDFDKAIDFCKGECIPRCYSHWAGRGLLGIGEYAANCMEVSCNLHRWEEAGDRLEVAITRLPFFQAERANSFQSQEDLKTALLASAAAFPFAPLVWRQDAWCIDGGFSDFQPIMDENTLTVSPFYFDNADIKPSRYVPLWWSFFPPKDEDTIEWLYSLGHEDTIKFITDIDDAVNELASAIKSEQQHGDDVVAINESSSVDDSDAIRNSSPNNISMNNLSMELKVKLKQRRYENRGKSKEHAYDTRRKVSIDRFLGYDTAAKLHWSITYIADFFLFIFLIFFWKPFALALIYSELVGTVFIYAIISIFYELLQLLPMCFLCIAFCNPHYELAYAFILILFIIKLVCVGPVLAFPTSAGALWDCTRCLFSFSLMRRFFSGGLSLEELIQNDKLIERSLSYRVFKHII